MSQTPHLSILIMLPLISGVILACLPNNQKSLARYLAMGTSLVVAAWTVFLYAQFEGAVGTLQFVERHEWIPSLSVEYYLGLDGLGLLMFLLTAILVPMAIVASWNVEERAPMYFGLMLMLQSGVLGTFAALNFFHWFLFWELSLIPAFFLVRLWGGAKRTAAATQFFIYTMVGSVALLLSFLGLFLATKQFNFLDLGNIAASGKLVSLIRDGWKVSEPSARTILTLLFFGAFLGFAIKVPLVPFHSWLPLTYTEAPTGTVMLLTGLMSKMGAYGFIRILLPIFPEQLAQWQGPLLWLAVFSIVFSAGAAFAQKDLKRLLAFSSIGHLGFCLLGVFSLGAINGTATDLASARWAALSGVILQMFNHGLTAATLFWFAGVLEQRARGLRWLDGFGGWRAIAPVLCGLMGISIFASLGLPGLNGFVSEFLILKGAFGLAPWPTTVSLLGLLITAVYLLGLLQKVFYGPVRPEWENVPDLTRRESALLAVPVFLMLLIGVWPQLLLGSLTGTIRHMVALIYR